ncbi:site-specific recombinase [Aquabacterium sp. A08]|uniref:site-specific recombinase n=1 Tax=Aquabacterium sp. A08 TaxID=2718532 RepID=UPI00141F2EE8|nr:site-specific recombinase [Aquabacterium sp. A08]NIC41342.1 site-specific recombinase [Aquabacterium sp. A08]NIC41353.1 site-specific recombinase [Aquabacterium sp. A08]
MTQTTEPRSAADWIAALDPEAGLAQRHLWLIGLVDWLRGPTPDVPATLRRLEQCLDAADASPDWAVRWPRWWQRFRDAVDLAPLLADFGFASKSVFLTELGHRLRRKLLPASPLTTDMAELFGLVFADPRDARWLRALPARSLQRLAAWLDAPAPDAVAPGSPTPSGLSPWEQTLMDALAFCVGQVSAAGFTPDLRVRMSPAARAGRTFQNLPVALEAYRQAALAHGVASDAARTAEARLRRLLDESRHAAYTVYAHLEEHGISVGIVFRLRQLRERVLRAKTLLDGLHAEQRPRATAQLLGQLVQVGRESRSIRALIATSTQLTAARVAERSAESGEHYITRHWADYRQMLLRAAGGGAVLGFTTWFKFLLGGLALSAFWGGLTAGLNYAAAFVLIQMLHFTVATKQPAVTAPAMVAKLKDLNSRESVLRFVDEVAHLFRSQVAAIAGNLLAVAPMVLCLSLGLWALTGAPMLTEAKARGVLDAHQVFGPTLLFAAGTGLLLFASSIVAGWVENWFVLHKLDSAIGYNPAITRRLGAARAQRWGRFLRTHISGLTANISLGLMLGLVPAVAGFFGLGADVRHVTLVMGQMAAAVATLGLGVLLEGGFWSAVLATLLVGPINLAVSFYLALRLALKAQGVSDVNRQRIQAAIRHRLRRAPWSFLWPIDARAAQAADAVADIPPADAPSEPTGDAEEAADGPGSRLAQVERRLPD